MKSNVKNLILLLVIIAVSAAAYLFYKNTTQQKLAEYKNPKVVQGESDQAANPSAASDEGRASIALPDLKFEDVSGNEVALSSFKGKVVILNFWASWCHICDLEMPDFAQVYSEYKDNPDVAFIFADLLDGQQETKEKALKYMDKKGFDLPVYFDKQGTNFQAFGLRGVPDTLLISKEGELVPIGYSPQGKPFYVHVGAMSAANLRQLISEELAQ